MCSLTAIRIVYQDLDLDTPLISQVIQRRMDGSVNFDRPWTHYKQGFGNKDGEYWLGETLAVIYALKNNHGMFFFFFY